MTFKEYIHADAVACNRFDKKYCLNRFLTREHEHMTWKFQYLLRKEEYWDKKGNRILSTIYRRKKNKLGEKLGITMPKNTFGPGLRIWHYGNIVINAYARVGKNCNLHGDNCIGNKGLAGGGSPVIGDNCDIGVGAKIIGDITIADNVTIGAGAIVNKSCTQSNVVLAGVPAKIIKVMKEESDLS